ncbi:MAG: glutathione S-transferase N-terminal domain-containing protein, partial [Gammaproteobacteria bacterium]
MLRLCGFHVSNYHNKVRLALMEKGVAFEEDSSCFPSQKEEFLARTPLGKVPF